MITRHRTWFPVYGALPNAYGMPANNACPLVFMWSMQAALELGAFAYARGVLHNHLRYYVTPHGFRYRGGGYIGFGWIAMYVEYTGDSELVMQVTIQKSESFWSVFDRFVTRTSCLAAAS